MIRIEKSFEREIVVDIVDMAKNQVPIGFETDCPHMHYRRIPYGKFGVRIKTPEPTDVVIRLDNVVLEHRRVDPGDHTIARSSDGKSFVFAAPGSKPAPAPAEAAAVEAPAVAQPESGSSATPEHLGPLNLAPSHGLVVVSMRFADVKPEHGPELPPDEVSHVVIQMNEPRAHLRTLAANVSTMVAPPAIPDGGDFVSTDGSKAGSPLPRRMCSCAPGRHEH